MKINERENGNDRMEIRKSGSKNRISNENWKKSKVELKWKWKLERKWIYILDSQELLPRIVITIDYQKRLKVYSLSKKNPLLPSVINGSFVPSIIAHPVFHQMLLLEILWYCHKVDDLVRNTASQSSLLPFSEGIILELGQTYFFFFLNANSDFCIVIISIIIKWDLPIRKWMYTVGGLHACVSDLAQSFNPRERRHE